MDAMSSASKLKTILQLFAGALHALIVSALVLGVVPRIGGRLGVAEPLRDSRLEIVNEFTDSAAMVRGGKCSERHSPPPAVAFAVFRSAQVQQLYQVCRDHSDCSGHRTVAGLLPIRSPPSGPSR